MSARNSKALRANTGEIDEARSPGRLILGLLKARGWTQRTLAAILEAGDTTISRLVSDRHHIDAKLALKLEDVFGIPAERILSLQNDFELAHLRKTTRPAPLRLTRTRLYSQIPISEMISRGWLAANDIRDTKNVEAALRTFFGVEKIAHIEFLPGAPKKIAPAGITPSRLAWLYRTRQIAQRMQAPPYAEAALRAALPNLRALMATVEDIARVPRILLECGIRYVIVESLIAEKIDGACFWLGDWAPVIGMSLRFDRIDHFWFTLRHEIEHVLERHGRDEAVIDTEVGNENQETETNGAEWERAANLAADDFCVPRTLLDDFISVNGPFFFDRDILGFARQIDIHPEIMAAQVRRRLGKSGRLQTHHAKIRKIILPHVDADGWGRVAQLSLT